ncbi:2-methylisocitrate lyase-like PEP mutase family enzyme [Actinoalloteichus hoggarensis]|uniref:Carboxyvinyl-carboxyphosphonate phosphorylmutase n=1 Tax=Actinoalloteichus hoggarensis TaxID=1470176 RepID=A0A221W395_9PSEU|nr:isocitrate lyase/phosphoenolpyruvate mutase family protein [Actinoalloteichus hoggarensis]ASO20310.1 Carboxyvinyl-carboxyphosphonate phosphorylmutase [Actinoalloteichus hoggarensis]MBB5918976.1 2-methylisocitrate lyase-like PEP mutase family enzyme [Actinoalloteichus hoggarensis]
MNGSEAFRVFRALHHGPTPLLLPNAWDHASGAALTAAGFSAVGTTSLGVAASAGLRDGRGDTLAETAALAAVLVELPVPISVDIEAGLHTEASDVADWAAELAESGIAGINVEDGRPEGLAAVESQCALIAAIADRAPGLFLNARVDTHWLVAEPPSVEAALSRARRYVAAGADGIFVPGITEPADIALLARELSVPLNVLAVPGGLDVSGLAKLGVRRISTGSLLFRTAVAAAVDTATALREGRPIDSAAYSYAALDRFAARRGRPER